jgi:hypothetical protein
MNGRALIVHGRNGQSSEILLRRNGQWLAADLVAIENGIHIQNIDDSFVIISREHQLCGAIDDDKVWLRELLACAQGKDPGCIADGEVAEQCRVLARYAETHPDEASRAREFALAALDVEVSPSACTRQIDRTEAIVLDNEPLDRSTVSIVALTLSQSFNVVRRHASSQPTKVGEVWSRRLVISREPRPTQDASQQQVVVLEGSHRFTLGDAEITEGCEVMYLMLKSSLVDQWKDWRLRVKNWAVSLGQAKRNIPAWARGWRPHNVEYTRSGGAEVALRGDIVRCDPTETTPEDVTAMLELAGTYLRWMDLDLEEHAMDFQWLKAALELDLFEWDKERAPGQALEEALLARYAQVDEGDWREYEADVVCDKLLRMHYLRCQAICVDERGKRPFELVRSYRRFGAWKNWKAGTAFWAGQCSRPIGQQTFYAGSAGSDYASSSGMAQLFNTWLDQGGRTAETDGSTGSTFGTQGGPTAEMRDRASLFRRNGWDAYRKAFCDTFPDERIEIPPTGAEPLSSVGSDHDGQAALGGFSSQFSPASRDIGFLEAALRLIRGEQYKPSGSFGLPGAHGFGEKIRFPLSGGGHKRTVRTTTTATTPAPTTTTAASTAEMRQEEFKADGEIPSATAADITFAATSELENILQQQIERANRAYPVSLDMVVASREVLADALRQSGSQLTVDTEVTVTVKKFSETTDFALPRDGEVTMKLIDIAQGALQREYGTAYLLQVNLPADLATESDRTLFSMPSRIHSGSFRVTDMLENALKERIQLYERSESVLERQAVIRGIIHARVAMCLDDTACVDSGATVPRQALTDFLEGRLVANVVTFCGEPVSGIFAIPVGGDSGGMWLFNTARDGTFWMPNSGTFRVSDSFVEWFRHNILLKSYLERGDKKAAYESSGLTFDLAAHLRNRNVDRRFVMGYLYGFIPSGASGSEGIDSLAAQLAKLESQKAKSDMDTLLHTSSDTWKEFAAKFGKSILEGWSYALSAVSLAPSMLGAKTGTLLASLGTAIGATGLSATLTKLQDDPNARDALHEEMLIGAVLSAPTGVSNVSGLIAKLNLVKRWLAAHGAGLRKWGGRLSSVAEAGAKSANVAWEFAPGRDTREVHGPPNISSASGNRTEINKSIGFARKDAINSAELATEVLKSPAYRDAAERVVSTLFNLDDTESLSARLIEDFDRISGELWKVAMIREINIGSDSGGDNTYLPINSTMRNGRVCKEIQSGLWKGTYEVESRSLADILFDRVARAKLDFVEATHIGRIENQNNSGSQTEKLSVFAISLPGGEPRKLVGQYAVNRLIHASKLLRQLKERGWLGSFSAEDDEGASSIRKDAQVAKQWYLVASDDETGAIRWVAHPIENRDPLIDGFEQMPLTEQLLSDVVETLAYRSYFSPSTIAKLASASHRFTELGISSSDELGFHNSVGATDERASLEYRLLNNAVRRSEISPPTKASALLVRLSNISNLAHSFVMRFPESAYADAVRTLRVQVESRILQIRARIGVLCAAPADREVAQRCGQFFRH